MEEGEVFGLSWSARDYDESDAAYEGFWNLSHHTRMDFTADLLPDFKLMPLDAPSPQSLHPDRTSKAYGEAQKRKQKTAPEK